MKVQCLFTYPPDDLVEKLGPGYSVNQRYYGLTPYQEYLVVGLACWYGTVPHVDIVNDDEHLRRVPLTMFRISDPRVSCYWEAREQPDGTLTLLPPSLYDIEFYQDRLSDGDPEVVQDFARVRTELDSEFPPDARLGLSMEQRESLKKLLLQYWPVGPQDDAASIQTLLSEMSGEEVKGYTQLMQKLIDSPEPLDDKSSFIRSATWQIFPEGLNGPIEWLSGIQARLEHALEQP